MAERCVTIITKSTQCPIAYVGISVGKFVPAKGAGNFMNFFKPNKLEGSPKISLKPVENREVINLRNDIEDIDSNKLKANDIPGINIDNDSREEIPETSGIEKLSNEDDKKRSNETDDSPTSRKVNNLIQSLSVRTSKRSLYKNMVKKGLNESLDQDKFKGSFFMNAFNTKENDATNRKADYYDCDLDEETTKNIPTSSRIDVPENSNEKLKNTACTEEKTKENSVVRLQEIFPDLNNIDASIVALLPPDLQEEARLYTKTQKKANTRTETTGKSSRTKGGKSKVNSAKGKKSNNIDSFLVKKNSKDMPLKRCMECQQMISVLKMEEHKDFHVAQTLQNELNLVAGTGLKRRSADSEESTAKRRSLTEVVNKNCQPITAFLT